MNKLVKDALILTLITLIAGTALGIVYEITKAPIAAAQEKATQEAYKAVFSDATSFADHEGFDADVASKLVHEEGYTDDDIDNCVDALDASGNLLGYVITVTSHAGYGGDITFSMGVKLDGTMNGYSITTIGETAGLGMKAKESGFSDQFKNIVSNVYEVVKSAPSGDNEIQAISGATITSKAMTNGVNAGFKYFNSLVGGGENE
ncbi:MAG: RnfABCDGE type electron transport complex subunit G [Lachnospiraceae bacterium]|nr:RnfABCDGE type electron transport complex subunit G [Lachnospiraceae bacterium]